MNRGKIVTILAYWKKMFIKYLLKKSFISYYKKTYLILKKTVPTKKLCIILVCQFFFKLLENDWPYFIVPSS
jgi:hypothetical protein